MSIKSRGIYLVANHSSELLCRNLIFSIRESGCLLPISVLDFGGRKIGSLNDLAGVAVLRLDSFGDKAADFISHISSRMDCSEGLIRRYLAWFGEYDEFLYSDNDVVALTDWTELFDYLDGADVVHADHEFENLGKIDFKDVRSYQDSLNMPLARNAITGGFFLCRRQPHHVDDIRETLEWMESHRSWFRWHDQTLLRCTMDRCNWVSINLCREPHEWLDPWAYRYKNPLNLMYAYKQGARRISHLHYAGYTPDGTRGIEELCFAEMSSTKRLRLLLKSFLLEVFGLNWTIAKFKNIVFRIRNRTL